MPRSTPSAVTATAKFSMPGPRLWNAKRRIQSSKGVSPAYLKELEEDPFSETWRSAASKDVVEFIDKYEGRDKSGHPIREMHPEQKIKLLQSPARYFSRPHNVSNELRKQVRFPDFTITLLRTPHLGPQYASFDVPLWFGKLDLKSYLQNLYDVETHHIRSFVIYQKVTRRDPPRKYAQGPTYQPPFKKKMTVQLVQPFVWPEEISKKELNSKDYEADVFHKSIMAYLDTQREDQDEFRKKPNVRHRMSIAEQAKAFLQGKDKWEPTWKQISPHVNEMEGRKRSIPAPDSASDSPSLLR